MKNKIKLIIIFILGIIVSLIINVYSIIKVKEKEVIHEDKKVLESTSDPDYINGVYSSSSTINSNITNLKKFYQLWGGDSGHNETKTLTDSIAKYKFLLVLYNTNFQYYTDYIPVSMIDTSGSKCISKTTLEHSSNGQISQNAWSYQATVDLCFTSNTTFKTIQTYSNANLKLKVWYIFGVGAA